jgi:hypothetical protein
MRYDEKIIQRRRSPSSTTLVLIGTPARYGCGKETAQRDVHQRASSDR